MGRHAEGWRLRWKGGLAYVRFSIRDPLTGKTLRPEIPTGERDPKQAHARASALYSEAIAGRLAITPSARTSTSPLLDLVADWLEALKQTYPASTVKCYREYSYKWLARWRTLGDVTTLAVADYTRDGLTRAMTKTIRKELAALLGNFFSWAIEQGHASEAPVRPVRLLKKSTGKRTGTQRVNRVEATPRQVARFIDAIPEYAGQCDGNRWRARDAVRVMYETGLRPSTVARLSVPEHWAPGRTTLLIDDASDKARFGRELPLSKGAIEALTRSAPVAGVFFGRHDYRYLFAAAVEASGAPEGFSLYDVRHMRGQHLVDAGAPITGVAYLLGHKRLTTTNIYVRASQKEAARALDCGEILGKSIVGKRAGRTK